ncbi:MAG: hypothetical protein AAGJ52_09345 [Pseudomonadota bacterium]
MIRRALPTFFIAALSLCLSACAAEDSAPVPQGLDIQFSGENDGQAPCRIERLAVVDQDQYPLYMVRGEGNYRLEDGQTRNIPVQIQFLSLDGVDDDTAITLTDFDVTCDQVAIEWTIEYCQNHDREHMECPPFNVSGQEAFREFTLAFEGD